MPPEAGPGPRVTVSLVTYNGATWLPGCLASLRDQTFTDYELLLLDNASTDGTIELLRAEAELDPRASLDESHDNLGFARAHNRNIQRARGDFVCLLNQDIELDADFLRAAVAAFSIDDRIGAVQARVRRLDRIRGRTGTLDTTGLHMSRNRRVVSRGQGEVDGPEYRTAGPIFGVDGPVPVYRRAALLDARVPASDGGYEVLDEDFFMYKEDVDLAWRLALLGWRSWYAPAAVAWHARGAGGPRARSMLEIARTNATIPRWIKAASWRNQRLMQVKNELPLMYLFDLPWIVRRELLSIGFILVADSPRLSAIPEFIRLSPAAMRKRRYIQRRRRVSREEIRHWFCTREDASPADGKSGSRRDRLGFEDFGEL